MFSPYVWHGQNHTQKGPAQPQAWHAGDVSALQGEACELAGVTRRGKPSLRAHAYCARSHGAIQSANERAT